MTLRIALARVMEFVHGASARSELSEVVIAALLQRTPGTAPADFVRPGRRGHLSEQEEMTVSVRSPSIAR